MLRIITIFCFVSSAICFAQTNENRNRDMSIRLERDINEAESRKKSGITKVVIGIGLQVVGYVAFAPSIDERGIDEGSPGLWLACVGTGAVLGIWGSYQWWSASQELAVLKGRRYDFTFNPGIDLQLDDMQSTRYSLNFALKLK